MRFIIALLSFTYLFSSCGGDTTNETTGSATLDATLADLEAQSTSPSSGSFCLGKPDRSVCEFLDADLIAGYLPDGAEQNGYKDDERSMLSACGYSEDHPTETTQLKVANMTMDVPATYVISLYGIKAYDDGSTARNRFKNEYKTLTPEEAADIRQKMEEGIDAKRKSGELTADQAEMAKGFGGAIGKSVWEPVPGIGDLAVWGNTLPEMEPEDQGTLVVLQGDTRFTLDVNLLESKEHSREAAIAIARSIIAACD